MAFAVDVIDSRGPSNETRRQLQPKKTKVRLYQPFTYIAAKDVFLPFITNKMKYFSLKVGVLYR